MNNLSIEARVVGTLFGMRGALTELSFDRPWIIHPRARKGLDELVEAGLLTVEPFNSVSEKLVWRPTPRMRDDGPRESFEFLKANSFPMTREPNQ